MYCIHKRLLLGTLIVIGITLSYPYTYKEQFNVCQVRPTSKSDKTKGRDEMLAAVNRERKRVGSRPLTIDPELMACSRTHTRNMVAANVFAHKGSNGLPRVCESGENIFRASYPADVENAVSNFMKSDGHRENMLDPGYTKFGWASETEPSGRTYYTQQFR